MAYRKRDDGRFSPNWPEIEEKLENWASWALNYAQAFGWAKTSEPAGQAMRDNTSYSNPTLWHCWEYLWPDGPDREMSTHSVLCELPAVWRKLIVMGYLENMGPSMIAEKLGWDRRVVSSHFESMYEEIAHRSAKRLSAKSEELAREQPLLDRIRQRMLETVGLGA